MVGRTASRSAARCSTPRRVHDFGAQAEHEELAGGMLVAVRQRQERQIGFAGEAQRAGEFEGAAAVRQDRPVRQHHPARCAAGARGVDQASQCAGRDHFRNLNGIGEIARVGHEVVPGEHAKTLGGKFLPPCLKSLHCHQEIERACLRHPFGQGGFRHDRRAGAAVAQDMRVVLDGVGGVDGHRHGADAPSARFRRSDIPAGSRRRSAPGRRRRSRPRAARGQAAAACRRTGPRSIVCHAPSRKSRSIGRSGQRRARSNIMAARFGQSGYSSQPAATHRSPARAPNNYALRAAAPFDLFTA